jgi:hypothetical protein
MATCALTYFKKGIQDNEITPMIEHALSLSIQHVREIKEIYNKEHYAIPVGFTNEDLNQDAPALFQDTFFIHYVKQMSRVGMTAYSLGLSLAVRNDIRSFYHRALQDSMKLDEQVTTIALQKGLYVRAPYINGPEVSEYVLDKDFLGGFFGEHRSLLGMEIAHLYGNIQTCSLWKSLCIGFSQASQSKEIINYMIKSRDLASQHIDVLGKKLNGSHLKVPMTWDDSITASTTSPFSEKLMMFHINAVMATAAADYGVAAATSLRKDLNVTYAAIIAELELQLEQGAKLMIKHGWMEKPPQATNRDELARKKS